MTDFTTAGSVVRQRREELGYSKAELARRARLTRSSIHDIECDRRDQLQERTMRALEEVLDLAPGTLRRQRHHYVPAALVSHALSPVSLLSEINQREIEELRDVLRLVAARVEAIAARGVAS